MSQRIDSVTGRDLEQIRTAWLQSGNKPSTVNRKMGSISGVFSRAVEWGYIETTPLAKLKQMKVDSKGLVRYLSPDETLRLHTALDARQDEARKDRDSANAWRIERKKSPLKSLQSETFTDHLKPMVLITLNTGLRRGELFDLEWQNVNFTTKILTVVGDKTKTLETRHIKMNKTTFDTLTLWQNQTKNEVGYVFPAKNNERLEDVKSAWKNLLIRAKIVGFRWHDMRHDFASRLVMKGAPLVAVRELLGHTDFKMTLRYAHLAPDATAAAIDLI